MLIVVTVAIGLAFAAGVVRLWRHQPVPDVTVDEQTGDEETVALMREPDDDTDADDDTGQDDDTGPDDEETVDLGEDDEATVDLGDRPTPDVRDD